MNIESSGAQTTRQISRALIPQWLLFTKNRIESHQTHFKANTTSEDETKQFDSLNWKYSVSINDTVAGLN